uniref:Uncharacterized protein n=1 Tax=Acanthochromis polyacanthus TaxID=80966 RepID=A0A3Q1GAU6_9TELE
IDECKKTAGICGSLSTCNNTMGSFFCTCLDGFQAQNPKLPPNKTNPCEGRENLFVFSDIDECLDNICGEYGTCQNLVGSFSCDCNDGFLNDADAVPVCQGICHLPIISFYCNSQHYILLNNVNTICFNSTICGPDSICTNTPGAYECACEIGYEPTDSQHDPNKTNICVGCRWSAGFFSSWKTLRTVLVCCFLFVYSLDIDECVKHVAICGPNANCTNTIGSYTCTCLSGYRLNNPSVIASYANPCTVEDTTLWKRHCLDCKVLLVASTLWTFSGSAAVAFLTLDGMESLLSHTYFQTENRTEMYSDVITAILSHVSGHFSTNLKVFAAKQKIMRWSVEGCGVVFTNENYTVCSCSHLSTFALILQIAEVLQITFTWLNRMCVIVGLFFFALAVFTFLLCSWNPKINNTALPFVIVGVSALVYSDGYGWIILCHTCLNCRCWLSEKRHFNWALTGPVITLNCVLFGATLWSLRPTLANMKSDVSQSKDTRLIVFKILAQFVILGCTWILGLYQTNLFFQVLFIVLNSQQGTFLFIVHCLLNKEVRDEYIKWLTCFDTPKILLSCLSQKSSLVLSVSVSVHVVCSSSFILMFLILYCQIKELKSNFREPKFGQK